MRSVALPGKQFTANVRLLSEEPMGIVSHVARKIDGLRWRLSTALALARLRIAGVRIGSACRFSGQPIVSSVSNPDITIGSRAVLVSRSKDTALGVSRPVILRCLTEEAKIVIGDDCGLSGTVICSAVEVRLGHRCLVGADVMIFDTDFHNHEPSGRRYGKPVWGRISKSTILGDDVFVGARSVIHKGVTIGTGSIIAAGSIVTRDIPPMSVAGGNPARVLKSLAFS